MFGLRSTDKENPFSRKMGPFRCVRQITTVVAMCWSMPRKGKGGTFCKNSNKKFVDPRHIKKRKKKNWLPAAGTLRCGEWKRSPGVP